jgi:hypothetical protein
MQYRRCPVEYQVSDEARQPAVGFGLGAGEAAVCYALPGVGGQPCGHA